ncbi:MAG: hypothetical protein Q4P06_00835 [Actinomycetaceae bacterium]|nr:hypothetical protein [Actinomycetaceae bacterium]
MNNEPIKPSARLITAGLVIMPITAFWYLLVLSAVMDGNQSSEPGLVIAGLAHIAGLITFIVGINRAMRRFDAATNQYAQPTQDTTSDRP